MTIINTTDANFAQDVLQSDKPVLVDFWASWCGPCRAIAPVLEDLDAEYGDKFQIVKVDVDANPNISAQFGIRSIPTLFVFKNGEKVDTIIGGRPKSEFVALLEKHLWPPQKACVKQAFFIKTLDRHGVYLLLLTPK